MNNRGLLANLFVLLMFRSVARAFTTPTAQPRLLVRCFADAPDTSIVDICQQKIQQALEATNVKVTGAYDDPNGSHISIQVVSDKFQGKRPVQRHQMVYKAIWEELQGPVHAVDAMTCQTPSEEEEETETTIS